MSLFILRAVRVRLWEGVWGHGYPDFHFAKLKLPHHGSGLSKYRYMTLKIYYNFLLLCFNYFKRNALFSKL